MKVLKWSRKIPKVRENKGSEYYFVRRIEEYGFQTDVLVFDEEPTDYPAEMVLQKAGYDINNDILFFAGPLPDPDIDIENGDGYEEEIEKMEKRADAFWLNRK